MILYPAVDLLEGRSVRLTQGDYDRANVYHEDPLEPVQGFKQAGAKWLHVVDLDAARSGKRGNEACIRRLCRESGLKVQLGGGIRSWVDVDAAFGMGVQRVILGTAALENPDFLEEVLSSYPDRVAVAADVKGGLVATHGWEKISDIRLHDFLHRLDDLGVQDLLVTDIGRDGVLQGPNEELYREILSEGDFHVIASGGVSDLEDVKALKALGLHGAIVGKALYTGKLDLKQALELAH